MLSSYTNEIKYISIHSPENLERFLSSTMTPTFIGNNLTWVFSEVIQSPIIPASFCIC